MLLWARVGNGKRAMDLLKSLIHNNVFENLWDRHPPFQIDGNFGYTAGVGEMLVGGSDGTVRILPALPPEWKSGEFSGIVSRGGIAFDCSWQDGQIVSLSAVSKTDTTVNILLPSIDNIENARSITLDLQAGNHTKIV